MKALASLALVKMPLARETSSKLTKAEVDAAARIVHDPVAFGHVVLGQEIYTPDQQKILRAVRDHPRVAVHSGHGTGKTNSAAHVVAWWLNTRHPSKVVTTASTWEQVRNVLWPEIRMAWHRARVKLVGDLKPRAPEIWVSDEHFAVGLSTNEPVAFQGKHSPNLLVVVDEAEGVPEDIHRACANLQPARHLIIGNPVEPTGPFYERCQSEVFHSIQVSCYNHPNVAGDEVVIPGAVTREWIAEQAALYGEGSPYFNARVKGEFPAEGQDTLISLAWVERAMAGDCQVDCGDGFVVIACDVAGGVGRNETVVATLEGREVVQLEGSATSDPMEAAGMVIAARRRYAENREVTVVVDGDGIGAGTVARLREQGIVVHSFRGGMNPKLDQKKWLGWKKRERFKNNRSLAWWLTRDALAAGELKLPRDDRLKAQLVGVKYEFDSSGLIQVERKEHMVERLGDAHYSPDRADAVVMALYGRRLAIHKPVPEAESKRAAPSTRAAYADHASAPRGGWNW